MARRKRMVSQKTLNKRLKRQCQKCLDYERAWPVNIKCKMYGNVPPQGKDCKLFRKARKSRYKLIKVYLRIGTGIDAQKVHCRICQKPILKGIRKLVKKDTYVFHPEYQNRPVLLNPVQDSRGAYRKHYAHIQCTAIRFGELRRAKDQHISVGELMTGCEKLL
jgi:hypothetical protein